MRVNDFDYDLPEALIAQEPLSDRTASRLMIVDPVTKTMEHMHFSRIGEYLHPGDVLVFNNSKVLPARLFGMKTDTGAKVELLLTRPVGEDRWLALAKPAKRLKPGTIVRFQPASANITLADWMKSAYARVEEELDEGLRVIRFFMDGPMAAFLDCMGTMPLPPYIHKPLMEPGRYQTVYAEPLGSVAAPTAGLHFTKGLLERLQGAGVELHFVTLHVGLGTFRPVSTEVIEEHLMHSEEYEVSPATAIALSRAKVEGRRIVAVGTTALRTLESAGQGGVVRSGRRETDIFIYPGYTFQIADALITNFHLPKSTLLMLVAAWLGTDFTRTVYQEAIDRNYRFFSFGDAMMIQRRTEDVERSGSL